MNLLNRIVVGHDLRNGGDIALQSALSLAKRCKAEIKLVHVIEPHPFYEKVSHPVSNLGLANRIAQAAGKKLEGKVSQAGPLLQNIHYEVCAGKPFVELIIALRAWQADLLVIGEARNTNWHSLGDTGEHVIRKSPVSVLVTKRLLNPQLRSILVPVDFSSSAKKAAFEAISLAECFKARIVFLHVIDLCSYFASSCGEEMFGVIPQISAADMVPAWESFLGALPLEKVSWSQRTEEGFPASKVVETAGAQAIDLIVIGTHGRTGLNHMLFGSVTERVAKHSPCPVLTIGPDAAPLALSLSASPSLTSRAAGAMRSQ